VLGADETVGIVVGAVVAFVSIVALLVGAIVG